tara:strand:- start:4960 stop:5538 length:579 start_codon:yes stop_codon:yes gene_type:complete
MNIIFFGPPGSGKGTQAKLLSEYLKISHLSTGDILRQKLNEEDELSKELKIIMSSGNLVSDNLLNQIITQKLSSNDCLNGFILDGYPRTLNQAEYLISMMKENSFTIDLIFSFNIDFKIVEQRIMDRFEKEKRTDDNMGSVKTRLENYTKETHPVSEHFRKSFSDIFFGVNASQEISEIQKELRKILKKGQN